MHTQNFIAINEFCINHNIEYSFITALQQTGLIEITLVEEKAFIGEDQLQQVEKFIHFYYDLDINMEGIESINHMLQQMIAMQDEIIELRNRLRLYELND